MAGTHPGARKNRTSGTNTISAAGSPPGTNGAARPRAPGPGPQVHGESYRFHGDQRVVIRDYYTTQFRSGRCPPGLARKHNGCVPPGHERVWVVGRPLPREVIY